MPDYNNKRRGPWCQTLFGVEYPYDPRPSDIDVRDFRALANICRYNGHVLAFYSVAEHSVRCADRAREQRFSRELQWEALVHDAHEVYGLGDVRGPLKRGNSVRSTVIRNIEQAHTISVRTVLGVPVDISPEVHWIDLELLSTERRDLVPASPVDWGTLPGPLKPRIVPMSPPYAWREFTSAWNRLRPVGVPSL